MFPRPTPADAPPPPPPPSSAGSSALSPGAIAGIVVGAVAGLVAIAGAYRLWTVHRQKGSSKTAAGTPSTPTPTKPLHGDDGFDDLEEERGPKRRPPVLPSLRAAQSHKFAADPSVP